MELLDSLVIPVSQGHLELLRLLLIVAFLLFLGYSAILYGSTLLSVYYNRIFKNTKDEKFNSLANNLIETITTAPTIWFGLGIAPLVGIILLYTQLLAGLPNPVIGLLIIALVLYSISIAIIYIYKNSVNLFSLSAKLSSEDEHIKELKESNLNNNNTLAMWSFILLTISMWFVFAAISSASNPDIWGHGTLYYIFMGATQLKFSFFVVFSTVIACATFLYFTFAYEGGKKIEDENYANFIKKEIQRVAIILTIALPLFLALNVITTPKIAVNPTMFGLAALAGIFIVLFGHILYSQIKENEIKRSSSGFWFLVIALSFFVVKEQYAFNASSYQNLLVLAAKHEKLEESKGGGEKQVEVNPEEIFNGKCSACHKFDVSQKTAPAYNDVAKKYVGKEAEMAAFILNPKAVNAAEYPQGMPGQGLKPSEAKAMAKWILSKVK
jgi:cytochrome c551/c552